MAATSGQFWVNQFSKVSGAPYSGVRVFHYVAGGTTTNLDVFTDAAMTIAAANPVVGDTSGRASFYGSNTYRLLIKSSVADGDLTLYDWDPVELVHHTATVRAQDRGTSLPAATAASRGRFFGTIDGGGDLTAMSFQRTAALWSSLVTLPTLAGMLEFAKGTTIASSSSVTIPSDGNFFDISGTTTIGTFSGFTGYPVIYTRTLSALIFTHSANLVLRGAASRTTKVNQITVWLHVGAGVWAELFYTSSLYEDLTLTDGAVLLGNTTSPITQLALPTAPRVLCHSGTTGQDPSWLTGLLYHGPTSTGSGSTAAFETFTSATQAYSGIHFVQDFTLNSGHTLTPAALSHGLIIIATDTITINGTIAAQSSGAAGGAASGGAGGTGFTQPGGAGGGNSAGSLTGGNGGAVDVHSTINGVQAIGIVGVGPAGTQNAGASFSFAHPFSIRGGAGGGGSANAPVGGAGGGSITLIAPTIVLAATATLNTSGGAGGTGGAGVASGGGGGAGNIYTFCRTYTDSGATFTQTGGAAGTGASGTAANGGAGAAGVKQILIYA